MDFLTSRAISAWLLSTCLPTGCSQDCRACENPVGQLRHYRAREFFVGHDVLHCRDVGWRSLSNGKLLVEASNRFDLLVTTDKKLRHEQHLPDLPISVLELNA